MAEKWPKMTQNYPKQPKNDPKLPIMAQKWPKIAKIAEIYLPYLPLFASLLDIFLRYFSASWSTFLFRNKALYVKEGRGWE